MWFSTLLVLAFAATSMADGNMRGEGGYNSTLKFCDYSATCR